MRPDNVRFNVKVSNILCCKCCIYFQYVCLCFLWPCLVCLLCPVLFCSACRYSNSWMFFLYLILFRSPLFSPPPAPSFFFFLQIYLNYLANYVPNAWNYEQGCRSCDQNMVDLSLANVSQAVLKKPHLGWLTPLSASTMVKAFLNKVSRAKSEARGRILLETCDLFSAVSVYTQWWACLPP